MPSPFPGIDPYLEGYLWPDVHNALANKIRQFLAPQIRPKYAARLAVYTIADSVPESEIGILYPDVEVVKTPQLQAIARSQADRSRAIAEPSVVLPVRRSVQVRLTRVEIRDTANNRLVTAIEILSPANKRGTGLDAYQKKRQQFYRAEVHLLELDFIRRGTRPFSRARLPDTPYCIALTRSPANQIEFWPVELFEPLPIVPVPLQAPDKDVPLDLQTAIAAIYEEAAYDLSLDYTQLPPPPALSAEELKQLSARGIGLG